MTPSSTEQAHVAGRVAGRGCTRTCVRCMRAAWFEGRGTVESAAVIRVAGDLKMRMRAGSEQNASTNTLGRTFERTGKPSGERFVVEFAVWFAAKSRGSWRHVPEIVFNEHGQDVSVRHLNVMTTSAGPMRELSIEGREQQPEPTGGGATPLSKEKTREVWAPVLAVA